MMNVNQNNRGFAVFSRRFVTSAAIILGLGTATTSRAVVVFDDISNVENGVTNAGVTPISSTPNTFAGDPYNLVSGTIDITGFDLFLGNNTGNTYTGLKITIYVWGSVNTTGTVNATTPAFSNLLNTYTLTTSGTFASGSSYKFESATPGVTPAISLTTPLALSSSTVGLTFAYQGTTDGTTYASANSLTSLVSYGTAPTVGSEIYNGYYRNANSETNGNFTSTLRFLSFTNQGLAVRVYGDVSAVPEPNTQALLGIGTVGAGLMALRRRRARA